MTDDRTHTEAITLTQVTLGLRPYCLIEADIDPADGELVLKIKMGGGAAEEPGTLPLMMITELPDSPLHSTLRDLRASLEFPEQRAVIDRISEALGVTL